VRPPVRDRPGAQLSRTTCSARRRGGCCCVRAQAGRRCRHPFGEQRAGASAPRAGRCSNDELRSFAGELGGLSELRQDIDRLLDQLRPADAQESDAIAALRERLDSLGAIVFESRRPRQALHGDVSLRNLLCTSRRLVWNDFEDTFRGPVHWDVASYVGSLRIRGASDGCVREMLDGYRWDDDQELAPFLAVQDVYDEIWRMYDRQRRRSWPAADPRQGG
jgi:hypothetical protein